MPGRAGKSALVKVSGAAATLTNAATTANGGRTEYQITDSTKRVLAPNATITVETSPDGSAWSAAAGYTLNRLTGTVTFGSAQPVGTQIRVSGQYLPMSTAASCKQFSYTVSATNIETPAFGDSYIPRIQGLQDIKGSLGSWRTTDTAFEDALTGDVIVMLEIYSLGSGTPEMRVWARLNTMQVQSAIEGAVDQGVECEGVQDADGRTFSAA